MRVSDRRGTRRSGAAAVEMAIVLPLFVGLIMGTIEASRLGMVSQLLHVAAREGCRTAVLPGHTQTTVKARVDAVLAGSGITLTKFEITSDASDWRTAPASTRITVTLEVPFKDVSWLGNPFAFKDTKIVGSATMSSEKNP